jgi:hypothetical protein
MRPSNCKNCAGPLNWKTPRCEYCDTFWEAPARSFDRDLADYRYAGPRKFDDQLDAMRYAHLNQQRAGLSLWHNILLGAAQAAQGMIKIHG